MVLVDARPPGVDARFRPGNTFTLTLTWPTGELSGRSFTATLDDTSLAVQVVGDVMTITATDAQTTAVTQTAAFRLTETTGGLSDDVIIGRWSPDDHSSTSSTVAVTVTESSASVAVTVSSAPASPEVVHDWDVDGWDTWSTQLVNNGSAGGTVADQSLSVVAGRGRITNTFTDGNLRVAYEREGTDWENSEVLALWHGASVFDSGTATPQMGQFHRGYVDADGRWRAVVVTNNIFLTDVNVVNQNVWNHDPTQTGQDQLDLGTNGGSITLSAGALARTLQVRAVARINFGGWINQYVCEPRHLYGMVAGQNVTVDVTDATFDQSTAAAVASVDTATGTVALTESDTLSAVSMKFEQGVITPTTAGARRWWPYWVRSQLVDAILRVKVWRYLDPEPDWADTNYVVTQDFTLTVGVGNGVAGTPEPDARMPEGVGRCGLIGAHIKNSAYMEYGHFSARQL